MSLTISAVALLGLLVFMLVRSRAAGIGTAIVVGLFGFYLARTGAAASIDQIMSALADALPKS